MFIDPPSLRGRLRGVNAAPGVRGAKSLVSIAESKSTSMGAALGGRVDEAEMWEYAGDETLSSQKSMEASKRPCTEKKKNSYIYIYTGNMNAEYKCNKLFQISKKNYTKF